VTLKPPTTAELVWTGDLQFTASLSKTSIVLDSAGNAGPSPVEALAAALAGCMGMDLVHILKRGRHDLAAVRARLVADRSADDPKRILAAVLHFSITTSAPYDAIVRAIDLSRERYCSVWQSMRQDIDFRVTFEVEH
jgi:putative redox protein